MTQGIAVRRDYEAWFDAPAAGTSREILLLYGSQEARATLRRLANESESVQIRYESKRLAPLREWLRLQFGSASGVADGRVLEIRKVDGDTYRLIPITGPEIRKLNLCLGPGLYHNNSDRLAEGNAAFADISAVVGSIGFDPQRGQVYYNEHMKSGFVGRGWLSDQDIMPGLPLRYDFRKGDVQVEVEFGNARSYYQDYLKFLLPFTRGIIRVGVLLVPTGDFARLLCAAGTRRAVDRITTGGANPARLPKYSGMITYEKVEREFEALRFLLNMPMVIRGIDFWGRS